MANLTTEEEHNGNGNNTTQHYRDLQALLRAHSHYEIDSIRYHCATLWNKYFKKGEINVDDDKKNNVKLVKIKNKKSFNWILKKHFLHSYTITQSVIFY